MDIKDFSQPLSSSLLNETLAKKFGYTVDLARFSNAQLEDARNKLRTRVSQFEMSESYTGMLENHDYQKVRTLLDVVNQEIFEREMTPSEKDQENTLKKIADQSGMKQSMQKQYGPKKGKQVYFATIRKRAMDEAIPESWIESAIQRIDLGESSNSELKAELKLRYDLSEQKASWMLCEGEEIKAEIIVATKDLVGNITRWLEDVASMKAEQFLELVDSIRSEFGAQSAQTYQEKVRPALDSLYMYLEQTRNEINQALITLSGGEADIIGSPPSTPPAAAAGPTDTALAEPAPAAAPASRVKRESVEYSRRLSLLLNQKKR